VDDLPSPRLSTARCPSLTTRRRGEAPNACTHRDSGQGDLQEGDGAGAPRAEHTSPPSSPSRNNLYGDISNEPIQEEQAARDLHPPARPSRPAHHHRLGTPTALSSGQGLAGISTRTSPGLRQSESGLQLDPSGSTSASYHSKSVGKEESGQGHLFFKPHTTARPSGATTQVIDYHQGSA